MAASAGAFLALLTAATATPSVAAGVSLYGYGDIDDDAFRQARTLDRSSPPLDEDRARANIGRSELAEGGVSRNDFYVYCRQHGTWPTEVLGTASGLGNPVPSLQEVPTPAMPPTLLLHGDADVDIPIEMSERLTTQLADAGVQAELIRTPGLRPRRFSRSGDPGGGRRARRTTPTATARRYRTRGAASGVGIFGRVGSTWLVDQDVRGT